ncbi:MAG: hypothetical protein ABI700_08500 [Chloroflexota bacterium]
MIKPISAESFQRTFETLITPNLHIAAKSKRILLISGGNQGKLAQYQRIHEQGIKIIVLDAPDHWAKVCVETGLIEAFIPVDLSERESLFDEVLDAIVDSGLFFDEVLTFSDAAAALAARLAYTMGLSDSFGIVLH